MYAHGSLGGLGASWCQAISGTQEGEVTMRNPGSNFRAKLFLHLCYATKNITLFYLLSHVVCQLRFRREDNAVSYSHTFKLLREKYRYSMLYDYMKYVIVLSGVSSSQAPLWYGDRERYEFKSSPSVMGIEKGSYMDVAVYAVNAVSSCFMLYMHLIDIC